VENSFSRYLKLKLFKKLIPLSLKKKIKKKVFKIFPSSVGHWSGAQAGEDRIVNYLFKSRKIDRIKYIDIGANHPVKGNNTYLFYLKGSRGVLVEPDIKFHKNLIQTRPDDILIKKGIGIKEEENVVLYLFDDGSLNTLSKIQARERQKSGQSIIEEHEIGLVTIEKIIEQNFKDQLPELVSLDIEGMDLAIIESHNFNKYPVPVWIIETCSYSENHIKEKISDIIDKMEDKGYFVFGDTYINTIFVNKKWFYESN